jgi:hypothetical protein
MSKPVDQNALPAITQAFGSDCVVVPIAAILPVRAIEKTTKSSHKYRQIAASIREIGLVEPPVVIQDRRNAGSYLLLDGHLLIEVLSPERGACRGLGSGCTCRPSPCPLWCAILLQKSKVATV